LSTPGCAARALRASHAGPAGSAPVRAAMPVARCWFGLLAAVLLTVQAQAGPGQLAIWCAPAFKGVVVELVDQFERESGHAAVAKCGTVENLQARGNAGEPPDIVMFADEMIEGMQQAGKIDASTRMAVGRVGMGLAVRKGAPVPDISSADALRTALVKAASITYPDPGKEPGGKIVTDALARLGLAEALRARTRLGSFGQGVALVGHGEVELAFDHANEIIARPAVSLAGLLPGDLQRWAAYSAAVASESINAGEARPFLEFLAGKAAREKLRAAGFEPPQ
jgi:molybdate transport system substrate-binding protein